MYNINNNDKAVKMESYLDDQDNNHWKKVTSLVDDGGWYARASDEDFYSAVCGLYNYKIRSYCYIQIRQHDLGLYGSEHKRDSTSS